MNKLIGAALLLILSLHAGAQYHSLFWKISGNGLKEPSYLFGTMHAADPRIQQLGDSALPYFKLAHSYVMELDPAKAMDMGLMGKLMMGGDYSLQKMIPEKEYRFLDSIVKGNVGLGLAMFDNISPVVVMVMAEASTMGVEDTGGTDEILDMHFYNIAKEEKKKVFGIETVDEQLDALNALSYQEQADMLVQEVDDLQNNKNEGPDLLQFYLNQNLDSLAATDNTGKMPPKFYKALVADRNIRMAERIPDFIKKQSAFIAVGALHLPGPNGVIALLRKQGYSVEPMNNTGR